MVFISTKYASQAFEGDIEIAAKVCAGKVDLVIFFRILLSSHPHQADIDALMRICDLYEVPVVTNKKAADLLCLDMRIVPGLNLDSYPKRLTWVIAYNK